MRVPDIDEETLRKLPHWKQWLYMTMKEISEKSQAQQHRKSKEVGYGR